MTGRTKIMGKDFKKYVTLIPDDAEIYVGIGRNHSKCVDILGDIKNNRVILCNQSYIDDCREVR